MLALLEVAPWWDDIGFGVAQFSILLGALGLLLKQSADARKARVEAAEIAAKLAARLKGISYQVENDHPTNPNLREQIDGIESGLAGLSRSVGEGFERLNQDRLRHDGEIGGIRKQVNGLQEEVLTDRLQGREDRSDTRDRLGELGDRLGRLE